MNGLSQAVFPSGTANYINEQGWVEAPFDSDFDGKPDRIHIDVSRPLDTGDTDCDLKVPVIFEDSPYYANLGPSRNWAVDHELGSPPARAPPSRTSTRVEHEPDDLDDLRVDLAAARLRRHARGVAGHRLLRRLPDLGRPNETLAAKAVIDWLNGRAPAYTTRTGDDAR